METKPNRYVTITQNDSNEIESIGYYSDIDSVVDKIGRMFPDVPPEDMDEDEYNDFLRWDIDIDVRTWDEGWDPKNPKVYEIDEEDFQVKMTIIRVM